jgi:hypothetical protein
MEGSREKRLLLHGRAGNIGMQRIKWRQEVHEAVVDCKGGMWSMNDIVRVIWMED